MAEDIVMRIQAYISVVGEDRLPGMDTTDGPTRCQHMESTAKVKNIFRMFIKLLGEWIHRVLGATVPDGEKGHPPRGAEVCQVLNHGRADAVWFTW